MVDSGFHDVTLVNMADTGRPTVPVGDLSLLQRQWPVSVVSGMSQKQLELQQLRHTCKKRFRGAQTGCHPYCGTNIQHYMARHVSSYHLDLNQLWQCPVSCCTQWKGTPQDCVNHIRRKHFVNDSAKAANLGRWFPPWKVTRSAWHKAHKPHVSGVSTDAVLFSDNGSQLVYHYRVFGQSVAHASMRGKFMVGRGKFMGGCGHGS